MFAFLWFSDSAFAKENTTHKNNLHHHAHRYHHALSHAMREGLGDASIKDAVRSAVAQKLGENWVAIALKIAQIESRFQCRARNHGALGIFQVSHPERFGVSPARALTCEGGIEAGIAHMRHCIALGANSEQTMLRCHNSGSPFGRVSNAYRRVMHAARG